jgi:acyl-coenzyme A thioesterase PaaI-like protein
MSASERPKHYWDVPPSLPTGAWAAKRVLAKKLRELSELCVTTDAPEDELARAAETADAMQRLLAPYPRRTFKDAYTSLGNSSEFAVFADRTALTGESNPISPPMRLIKEGDKAVGLVTFGAQYEGIPGCVHGGFVAAAFDQVFGYLQVIHGKGAVTAVLEVRYRVPTPMAKELRIEASVASVEGRKSQVVATMTANGVTTAEASGTFVQIDPARMKAIAGAKAPEEH